MSASETQDAGGILGADLESVQRHFPREPIVGRIRGGHLTDEDVQVQDNHFSLHYNWRVKPCLDAVRGKWVEHPETQHLIDVQPPWAPGRNSDDKRLTDIRVF